MPPRSMLPRVAFLTFISLLACLTSATVICFSMAILDDAFVYAGIACLTAVVLLIGTYTGCRYLCRTNTCVAYLMTREQRSDVTDESLELDISQDQFRRLEREIEDLFGEVGELRLSPLGGSAVLDRQYENLRRDYDQLTQWIEGRKTPEASEVSDLVRRLDNIRSSLRCIRRRSERIRLALGTRRHSCVTVLTRSVDHHPRPPHPLPRLPLQPPPYDDTERQQPRHLSTERRQNPPPPSPSAIAVTYLPSYCAGRRGSLAPPADDFGAPPPYEEATTGGHPL